MLSSEEHEINWFNCEETSFAKFFSNIDKSSNNSLRKSNSDDGPVGFYLQGYKMPAEAAVKLGAPSDHLWRIVISGMKERTYDGSTFYTNKGIPSGNCLYDSLSDTIQCRNWNSQYSEDSYLTAEDVKITLEQFFDTIPVKIVDNKGTQGNPIWE